MYIGTCTCRVLACLIVHASWAVNMGVILVLAVLLVRSTIPPWGAQRGALVCGHSTHGLLNARGAQHQNFLPPTLGFFQ